MKNWRLILKSLQVQIDWPNHDSKRWWL